MLGQPTRNQLTPSGYAATRLTPPILFATTINHLLMSLRMFHPYIISYFHSFVCYEALGEETLTVIHYLQMYRDLVYNNYYIHVLVHPHN